MDEGRTDQLVFFAFDLLFLNGVSTAQLPLIKRKERLQRLFKKEISGLRYSEHVAGDGPSFRAQACGRSPQWGHLHSVFGSKLGAARYQSTLSYMRMPHFSFGRRATRRLSRGSP